MIYSTPIPALMCRLLYNSSSSDEPVKHSKDSQESLINYDTFSDVIIHIKGELRSCRFMIEHSFSSSDDLKLKILELEKLLCLYSKMRDDFLNGSNNNEK